MSSGIFGNKPQTDGGGALTDAQLRATPVDVNVTNEPNLNKVSENNSSETVLNAGNSFIGTSEECILYNSLVVSCKTDQAGTLFIDLSVDGINWDSTLSFSVTANLNEVHRITVTRKYFRTRYTNTSSSNQTYFRLQTLLGGFQTLNTAANSIIQRDANVTLVRPLDFNLAVAESLYQNTINTIKDGLNFDIDTATVPEDIWTNGGVYTGFPINTEQGQIIVAGADTGTIFYSYLSSDTDLEYTFGTLAVSGAGTYNLGHNIWRCNFAYFVGSNVNVSLITIRQAVTTTNVFFEIVPGYGQSFCSAYTVPYKSAIFLDRISGTVRGSATGSLDGFFWFREFNQSARLRFPFELQFGTLYFDDIDYLVKIPERTDIMPRIITSSANNLQAKISYRFVKIRE